MSKYFIRIKEEKKEKTADIIIKNIEELKKNWLDKMGKLKAKKLLMEFINEVLKDGRIKLTEATLYKDKEELAKWQK